MDFAKAFTYPFEDPDWARKILIPALIALIPIIGQIFLIGWMLEIVRRVIRHDPTPLPELDFGKQLTDGLKGFVIGLVYALPILVLELPIIISSGMASNMNENSAAGLVSVVSLCCGGLIFIYSLALGFFAPAALTNFVAKDNLASAFNINEIIGLVKLAPGAWVIVFLGAILSSIVGSLGTIACLVGVIFTYAYAMAINGHLYGQAYNESTKNQGFARVY